MNADPIETTAPRARADIATPRARADIATTSAQRYLVQLCKHFQHKGQVTQEGAAGRITFASLGACTLAASDGILSLTVDAEDEDRLARLEDVIARHLVRFAFRETLSIAWQKAT